MADELADQIANMITTGDDPAARRDSLRQNLILASDTNPDQYAEAARLGKAAKVPPAFVAAEMDQYKKDATFNADVVSKIVTNYPAFDTWLADQDNAKIAHDDVPLLTSVFDLFARAPASGAAIGIGMGVEGGGGAATDASRLLGQEMAKNQVLNMDRDTQLLRMFTGLYGSIAKPLGVAITAGGEAIDVPEERKNFGTDVASGIGQAVSQIVTYVANPYAGTAMMLGQGAQQQSERLDEAGVTDAGQRLLAQGAGAAATYATERVELGVLLKGFPGLNKVMDKLPSSLQNKWVSRSIDLAGAGGAEAAQETLEGFLQDTVEYAIYNPDVEFLQDLKETAAVSGVTGAVARALVIGIEGGRKGNGHIQAQKAAQEKAAQTIEDKAVIQKSKLMERDPERLQQIVTAANAEREEARFDSAIVNEFFQSGIDPEEFYAAIPEAREAFEQADLTGADVVLPMDKVLMAMAQADAGLDFMTDFMKADENGPRAGEDMGEDSPEFNERVQEILNQTQDEFNGELDDNENLALDRRIERQVADALMSRTVLGEKSRTPEAARSEAALYGTFARTLLKKGGNSTRKVVEDAFGVNLEFRGPKQAPRLPVDSQDLYIDRLRSTVKSRRYAQERASKRSAQNLFGLKKQSRAKATPTPLINALIARGGIDSKGKIAAELKNIGITRKTHSRLFKKGVMRDIDNIVASELEAELGVSGIFSNREDNNGYVDRNELIDALRDETFGNYIRTEDQIARDTQDEYDSQVVDAVEEAGLDIETATNAEVKAAIAAKQAEYAAKYEEGEYYQDAPLKTDTPEFKAWFGDSKVVDENGKPLVVYHGSPQDIDEFKYADGRELPGFFNKLGYFFDSKPTYPADAIGGVAMQVSDNGDITEYPFENDRPTKYKDGMAIYPVYLSIKNPWIGDIERGLSSSGEEIPFDVFSKGEDPIKAWMLENGYDGMHLPAMTDGDWWIAFKPTQIKSVNNRGTFDKNDARILYQGEYDGKRGSIKFGDDGKTIISLFAGADQTTLLHETGHFFLDVFGKVAALPDAPQDIKDDYAKALKWLGVESADQIGRDQHEQFARGFEAYLMEGKAPSVELVGIFDKFRLWFANLYGSIKSLNVPMNEEIRGVMDRLLATNDEIDALRNNQLFNINPATAEVLTAGERAQYERQREKAFNDAKDKLFRKAIRQKRREGTQWWKEETDRIQALVTEKLMAEKVYRATGFAQTQQKMDDAAIVALYQDSREGRQALKYLPRGTRTNDGAGIDPKIIADMFGYKSARAMLEEMMNAPALKLAVQQQTETEMVGRYGDMLNDGTIEREALEMVMAESTEMAMVEMAAMGRQTGIEYPTDGDFKKAAEITLGKQSVEKSIAPDQYYRAALRAAKEYGKAVAAKRFEDEVKPGKNGKQITVKGAASWKRTEILNKHMFRLSRDAREDVNKALERFKKLNKTPPKGKVPKIDPVYQQKIWDILDKYDIGPRLSEKKKLRLELAAINAWIVEQETNEGAQLEMPPELAAADGKTHYRDLTLNEFIGLRDLVTNIETQGRNKQEYIIDGQKRAMADLVNELTETALQHNDIIDVAVSQRRQDRRLGRILGKVVNAIDAVNTKTQQVMVQLDGGDNLGLWTRTVYEPVQRAEIAKNVRMRQEYEIFKTLMAEYYGDEKANFLDREIPAGGEPIRFEEMLSLALNQGTEDNRQKIIDGYGKARGWDQDFIDRILSNMSKKDWQYVEAVWTYLDSFWPETSAVEQRRFGFAPEKIEAAPFETVTKDGERLQIKGGYMRIMYDPDQSVEAQNNQIAESFNDMRVGKGARAQTKRGSQIERVSGVKRPIRLDLDVLTEHISEQVGIITMAETIDSVAKVLKTMPVQEVLTQTLGQDKKNMLDLWLQDVAIGGALAGGTINKTLRTIRANYTVGRLGLKPVNILLQFSGLAHTVADYGARETFKGMAKLMSKGWPYAVIADIQAKSVYMQERKFTLNRDIADALNAYTNNGKQLSSKVAALMLYPMQKVQELVDGATWLAGYNKAIKDGLDEDDAVRAADIGVSRLQASGLTSDLAAIERGTISKDTQRQEWVKGGTMFFSYFNAKYNIIKNKNIQFRNKEIGGVDLAMSYLMAIIVEGAISGAIMGQLDWDDDDDDSLSAFELAKGVAGMTASQFAATIPFVRTVAGGWQGFSGGGAADTQLSGLGEFANTVAGAGEALITGETERINGYQLTRQALDAGNVFFPYPAATLKQFTRGLEKEAEGDASAMDYLVYQPK